MVVQKSTEEILRLGGKVTFDLAKLTKGLTVSGSGNVRLRKHWESMSEQKPQCMTLVG